MAGGNGIQDIVRRRYYKTWEIAFWADVSIVTIHNRAKKMGLVPKGNSKRNLWSLKQAEKLIKL